MTSAEMANYQSGRLLISFRLVFYVLTFYVPLLTLSD